VCEEWVIIDASQEPTGQGDYPEFRPNTDNDLAGYLHAFAKTEKKTFVLRSGKLGIKIRLGIGEGLSAVRVYKQSGELNPLCALADHYLVDEEVAFLADGMPMYFDRDVVLSDAAGISIVQEICQTGSLPSFVKWRLFDR
jgi:hypothetical protein